MEKKDDTGSKQAALFLKKPLDFRNAKVYIVFMGFKSEVKRVPGKKKMGRPTDSPKTMQFSIRFDSDTLKILDEYCSENQLTRPQGVSEALRKLIKK